MTDKFSPERRSKIMSSIRSQGNRSTELKLIEIFKEYKIRGWRRHYKAKGRPDFVFPKQKVAVFVDGCFWHGHSCKRLPKENTDFWRAKIERNIKHDLEITALYRKRGWQVLRIWECRLRKKYVHELLDEIHKALDLGKIVALYSFPFGFSKKIMLR